MEDALDLLGDSAVGFLWPAREKVLNGGDQVGDDTGDSGIELADRATNLVDE